MENIKEKLLKVLEVSKKDKEEIEKYLEINDVETLFKNYKDLDVSNEAKDQIDSLGIILENFRDK